MEKKKHLLTILLIAFSVVTLDQISKWIVSSNIAYGNSVEIVKGFFSITNARNFGAAWSIFWKERTMLIIVALAALIFVTFLAVREKKLNLFKVIYYGLLIGGIIGNLIDRVLLGYVIDFLDFIFFGYDYPIFNICDVFIVISILLICIECFLPKHDKTEILEEYNEVSQNNQEEVEVLDFDE